MEIYNEQIYDLLESVTDQPQPATNTRSSSFNAGFSVGGGSFSEKIRKNLHIRDRGGKVVVEGLSNHQVSSADAAMALIEAGSKERQTCSHNLNNDSSRSHSVCSIELIRKGGQMSSSELNNQVPAILWLVDLAGSERGERTGAGGVSKKQTEANAINTSLFTLMTCLGSLRENSGGNSKRSSAASTGRYRESKLTRLLAPHLSGSSQGPGGAGGTCMIVNANPRASDFVETCYVLSQTAPCTKIKIKANKSSGNSLLAAAAKIDKNGRRIMKGAAMMGLSSASSGFNGGSRAQQGDNFLHKKRSLMGDNSHPNRRARLESMESMDSNASASAGMVDIEEFNALKLENMQLRAQLEEARNEADSIERMVRDECAEEMDAYAARYFSSNNIKKSSTLSAVAEDEADDASMAANTTDVFQSARKKKKQENLQKMIDDLNDKCDDLEDELSRYAAENQTLSTALSLARKESDAHLSNSNAVPERWIMLDFITQLLTAPDTIRSEDFEVEANALKAALATVSFSSPMRRCADFDQYGNGNNKVEQISRAIRSALRLDSGATVTTQTGKFVDNEAAVNSNVVAKCDSEEEVQDCCEDIEDVAEDPMNDGDNEAVTENPLLATSSSDDDDNSEDGSRVEPAVVAKSATVSKPSKIITQLAEIDPNSPHKHKQQEGKGSGGKYSPSVIGNMSKRIREKAVKKTKVEKKSITASPRRTRSSTLFLRA
jgi:hypothetical protein